VDEMWIQSIFQISQSPKRITNDQSELLGRDGGVYKFISLQGMTGDCKMRSGCFAERVAITHLLISAVRKLLPDDYLVELSLHIEN
jgi:hypothetical protein